MSLLLSSTLANPTTPYYALAGAGGGGVSALTAGSNVVLTPSSGVGSVQVSLSNVLTTSSTTPTTLSAPWGAVGGYPTTPASGQVVGQTFVAPRSGAYLCEVGMGFNVSPSAVVAGTGDLVTIGLNYNEPFFGIIGSGTLQPLNMPSSATDYSLKTSFIAILTGGATYKLFWYVNNTSTTLNLGEASGGGGITILPLC